MDYCRSQISATLLLHKTWAELRRHVCGARIVQARLDALPNRSRCARHCECRQTRLWIFGRLDFDRIHSLSKSFADFFRVTRGPYVRAVDAAATAVQEHAVDHHVDVLLPVIHYVVAE